MSNEPDPAAVQRAMDLRAARTQMDQVRQQLATTVVQLRTQTEAMESEARGLEYTIDAIDAELARLPQPVEEPTTDELPDQLTLPFDPPVL